MIATLGQHLFVLEVKSTFLRRSKQEAWLHASSTLRKAGRQLERKLSAVSQAIGSDLQFRTSLGLTGPPAPQAQHGWIVDTCIECDHQRFSGFLKVSLEEVLIALRDDRHLLNDPEGLLSGTYDPDRFAEDEHVNPPGRFTRRAFASSASSRWSKPRLSGKSAQPVL